MTERTRAYWVTAPGSGELRGEEIATTTPPSGYSLVRAEFGGVSVGTERTVGLGRASADAAPCRYMAGDFSLPIKYGYSLVGTGVGGELTGRRVFVMHPHQELVTVRDTDATPLPDGLPGPRATLIPNLETALNAVWDAELAAGERAAVVGGGSIGLLVAFVLHHCGHGAPTVVEIDAERRRRIAALPFVAAACPPEDVEPESLSVAFHATGTGAGLQTALSAVGFEGRVVELSWFGSGPVSLDLGAAFHFGRKRILASQVGGIARSHRKSHGFAERLARVLDLLSDASVEALLGPPVPFDDLPQLMEELYRGRSNHPFPVVAY